MKIGIWLASDYNIQIGGGYSYYSRLISEIDKYNFDKNLEIVFITYKNKTIKKFNFNKPILLIKRSKINELIRKIIIRGIDYFLELFFVNICFSLPTKKSIIKKLTKENIKLIYYPIHAQCEFPEFPFITTNWDIGYKSSFAFDEFCSKKIYRYKEYYYNNILPRAISIFCESNSGKKELIDYLRINPNKVKVVPLFAGDLTQLNISEERQIEILSKISTEREKYFFYPAQFWTHKNHFNLINAMREFNKENQEYKLFFTGADKGNFEYLKKIISDYKLENIVINLGFVNKDILYTLYKNAVALIMPTFLGPTNMPLLEALDLECPVLCSDFEGHREQLGDTALYFNPLNYEEIYNCMIKIIDKSFRQIIKSKIREKNRDNYFSIGNAISAIERNLLEIKKIRNCWNY